jgi:hypothetical protein
VGGTELLSADVAIVGCGPVGVLLEGDWAALCDRWEWSHVVRAVLEMPSLAVLVIAVIL